jgi:hypothetical protein
VSDARRALSLGREQQRARAARKVAAALAHDVWGDELDRRRSPLVISSRALRETLDQLPLGNDRELVRESLDSGAHVFLTRDKGVLRCARLLKPLGLLIASPLDLLEELVSCGAMLAVMRPESMYWPVPDLQRMSHLIEALPQGSGSIDPSA